MIERPSLPDAPNGQQLVDSLHELAAQTGRSVNELAAEISSSPSAWLRDLPRRHSPKPGTVARVKALLAGQDPGEPPRRFSPNYGGERRERVAPPLGTLVVRTRPIAPDDRRPPAASRNPCSWCGVRGDVGCRHQAPYPEEVALV